MGIKLKVGQAVRRRDGQTRQIVCDRGTKAPGPYHRFVDDKGAVYSESGAWSSDISSSDIVEIISEPDCVQRELRELTAHVTREFADLHERIAKLEQPETVNWDGEPDSPGDPFAVDWSEAPDWAMWRAVDENGRVDFYKEKPEVSNIGPWWTPALGSVAGPHGWHDGDCKGWRQSLRRRPEPEFKRGDRVMVRDSDEQEWRRRYYTEPGDEGFPHRATGYGPWACALEKGVGYRFCRHPTPDELEGY